MSRTITYLKLAYVTTFVPPSPVEVHPSSVMVSMVDPDGRLFKLVLSREQAAHLGSQIEGASCED